MFYTALQRYFRYYMFLTVRRMAFMAMEPKDVDGLGLEEDIVPRVGGRQRAWLEVDAALLWRRAREGPPICLRIDKHRAGHHVIAVLFPTHQLNALGFNDCATSA